MQPLEGGEKAERNVEVIKKTCQKTLKTSPLKIEFKALTRIHSNEKKKKEIEWCSHQFCLNFAATATATSDSNANTFVIGLAIWVNRLRAYSKELGEVSN